MKKFQLFLMTVAAIIIACMYTACHNGLSFADPYSKSSNGKVCISFKVKENNQKTAMPSISWDNFDFMITYKTAQTSEGVEVADEEDLFDSKKTLGQLGSNMIVPTGYYIFTLKAYPKGSDTATMQSSATDVLDLTSQSQNIGFYMKPVINEAFTGSAEITLKVSSDDMHLSGSGQSATQGKITKIDWDWFSNVTFAQALGGTLSHSDSTDSLDDTGGYFVKTYSKDNLGAGLSHYFVAKIYAGDQLMRVVVESLFIVKDMTAKKTLIVQNNQFNKYEVKIDLKKTVGGTTTDWINSNKVIVLVDSSGTEYTLTDKYNNGEFSWNGVEDGEYNIYIRDIDETGRGIDTGLNITAVSSTITNDSNEEIQSLNFVETDISPRGVDLTPVEPMVSAIPSETPGTLLIVDGSTVPVEFTVTMKDGFEADPDGTGITVGGKTLFDNENNIIPEADTKPSVPGMQQKYTPSELENLSTSGVDAVEYSITYVDHTSSAAVPKGEVWASGSVPASVNYTVESSAITLKNQTDISRQDTVDGVLKGFTFNGWKNIGTEGPKANQSMTVIPTGTWGNIILEALWKDGVIIPGEEELTPEETAAGIEGTVLTSGYSLIVKWNADKTQTLVYIDKGTIGEFEEGVDEQVSYTKDGSVSYDFTNFALRAKNADGTAPKDDFTFTILGGKIACVEGPGKDAECVSTVNISGPDTIIGNGSSTGVLLGTLTSQKINVNAALTGNYSVTLVTQNKFRLGASTNTVATIQNSTYAQFNKFRCMYYETSAAVIARYNQKNGTSYPTDTPLYLPQELTLVSNVPAEIQLTNSEPIVLPTSDEIIWDPYGRGKTLEFQFGEGTLISINCSVFSISVSNGSFRLKNKNMKDENGNDLSTDKLAQYTENGSIKYHDGTKVTADSFKADGSFDKEGKKYTYLHMLSQNGDITPQRATEFLKTLTFVKTSADSNIQISVKLQTVPYSEIAAMTVPSAYTKFAYYDGSFYLNVNQTKRWDEAYNAAKQITFNGLNGYLMTITSDVENDYIANKFHADKAWTGASRLNAKDGLYDRDTFTAEYTQQMTNEAYPEAAGNVFKWQCGPEAGKVFFNQYKYNTSPVGTVDINYSKWDNNEPNDYDGTGECCMQFIDTDDGPRWNDRPIFGGKILHPDPGQRENRDSYQPESFVVEFRPYINTSTGTSQVATNVIMTMDGEF